MSLRIGVDVGGTNTDAVLMDGDNVLSKLKTPTTADVTSGITTALRHVLETSGTPPALIAGVMIGTTHFTNAVVERSRLEQTAIIRLALPATAALPPMIDWPEDLAATLGSNSYLCHGGNEFDGRKISEFNEDEVEQAARNIASKGIKAVAISSVFSPVNSDMEDRAAEVVRRLVPEASVTLSSEIGRIGLLERENAAILNASLRELARITVSGFRAALANLGINAPLFLTQNDGTLMNAAFTEEYPVLTFASGPTNSMRGAAFLSGVTDAMVLDIGGTTSDVGALINGFPRQASVAVDVGGVRTNFRMPDVYSFGLGGGSFVDPAANTIGPKSTGYKLTTDALVFGGNQLTTTDIAVASGSVEIGDPNLVKHLNKSDVSAAFDLIHRMAEMGVDRMRTSAEPIPLIIVGGGSILISRDLAGASEVLTPDHFEAANAVGAAIAQISGEVDRVVSLEAVSREEALRSAKDEATQRAIDAGADPSTVEIVDVEDIPLAYLPGNATRVRVKAVGDLVLPSKEASTRA